MVSTQSIVCLFTVRMRILTKATDNMIDIPYTFFCRKTKSKYGICHHLFLMW